MELSLYISTDDENVINKEMVLQKKIEIKLKDNVDLISPIIILKDDDSLNIMNCNYCYLNELKRYYFIRDIALMNGNMFRLSLECDVIESFKDDILNSQCKYNRIIKDGDFMDFPHDLDLRKDVDIYEGSHELIGNKNIVISTIGGVV